MKKITFANHNTKASEDKQDKASNGGEIPRLVRLTMKRLIYIILSMILLSSVSALVANLTQFDDGGSAFNLTANSTKYITLPLNSTIIEANITVKGYTYNWNSNGTINDGLTKYTQIVHPSYYNYEGHKVLLLVSNTGLNPHQGYMWDGDSWVENSTLINGLPDFGTAPIVEIFNQDGLKLIETDNTKTLSSYQWNGTGWEVNSSIVSGIANNTYWTFEIFNNSGIKLIANALSSYTSFEWNGTGWETNNTIRNNLQPFNSKNYVEIFKYDNKLLSLISSSTPELRSFEWNGTAWNRDDTIKDGLVAENLAETLSNTISFETFDLGTNNKILFDSELTTYELLLAQNINLSLNNTNFFSHPNNLTGTNDSIDFSTALESCNDYQATCPLTFGADSWGKLEISDVWVYYNKSYQAILTIASPNEITDSIDTGDSVSVSNINITNTGNSNATYVSFITVSTLGTPNYNSSIIGVSCTNTSLLAGSSILCNLTFNNLQQNPEPDEKLRLRATDENGLVYSTSIDVDITVSSPTSTPDSGGGGGGVTTPEVEFDIVGVNANNQDTAQISIRPSDTREYCLDIVNYANVAQTIYVECDNIGSDGTNVCSWISFDRDVITVEPSQELRETFCMDIKTPIDLVIGDRYVVGIKGTVTEPSLLKGLTDTHKVTMWVTDPAFVFESFSGILFSTSISDAFNEIIKEYLKEDINELNLPNIVNPLLIIAHILYIVIVPMLIRKPKFITYLGFQIMMLIFSVISMYSPVILLWVYILTISLVLYSLTIARLFKSKKINTSSS